MECQADR